MTDVAHGLRIRFGLERDPSDSQIRQWLDLTQSLERQGLSREQAAAAAARHIFPDYNTHFYASEADTIEALLRAAKNK